MMWQDQSRATTTRPTRQQLEWQLEAYKILDALPFSYNDPHFTLTTDDTGSADLRISCRLYNRGLEAGNWSGTIADLRAFSQAIGVTKAG